MARQPEVVERLPRDQAVRPARRRRRLRLPRHRVRADHPDQLPARADGLHLDRLGDGGRPEAGSGAGRPRLLAGASHSKARGSHQPDGTLRARGRPASAGTARGRQAPLRLHARRIPILIYEGIFLLYPMYRGLELGLQDSRTAASGSRTTTA